MFSFDGNYRRTPIQSLGGASRNSDRLTLIKKAAEERQKRAEIRRQNDGAIRIQSFVRSFIRRQKVKSEQRNLFDQLIGKKDALNEDTLQVALQRILFFYYNRSNADGERLVRIRIKISFTFIITFVWLFSDCPWPVHYQTSSFPVGKVGSGTNLEVPTEAIFVFVHSSDMPSDTQSG